MFDRIGNAHVRQVGYRGTRDLVFAVGNLLIDQIPHHGPQDWPLPPAAVTAAHGLPAVATLPARIPRLDTGPVAEASA